MSAHLPPPSNLVPDTGRTESMALSSGTIVGGVFELLRPIGEGGMGVVWLARERPLDREVALKIMRPSESATRLRRFEREARALAAIDHPGILPILRIGEDPATGLHFLATRPILLAPDEIRGLCDNVLHCPYPHCLAPSANREPGSGDPDSQGSGSSGSRGPDSSGSSGSGTPATLPLAALLEGGKALPEATVLRLARELAGALSAAHAAGILHRDLKPSNILFDSSGRALLVDFGLAKFVDSGSAASPDGRAPSRPERGSGAVEAPDSLSLDESGQRKFLGSPAYAAPETFRAGASAPDAPALDWYSFGAVLYEALTGNRPRSLRAPSSYDRAHISRAWDPFVAALLDPDPAKRLAEPAAIFRALDRIARRPAGSVRRRRLRWCTAAVAALAAAAVALVFALPRSAPQAPEEPEGAKAAEKTEVPESAKDLLTDLGKPGEAALTPDRIEELLNATGNVDWSSLAHAPLHGPRLSSIWQGDDRGPLQLLSLYRMPPVDDVIDEAIAAADPETRRLLQEGDAAWTATPPKVGAASKAYYAAAVRLREAMASAGDSGGSPPSVAVCRAVALARLSWTYVVTANHGAADVPYKEALDCITPLVEGNLRRYAPLRSWLLTERAYMECMEDRFQESLSDLREAGVLWEVWVPQGAVKKAQLLALMASLGGLLRAIGDLSAAVSMTNRATFALEMEQEENGEELPAPYFDLLAGCRYRHGELLRQLGSRLEALRNYRRARDLWREQFQKRGESYRLTYAQVLGFVAATLADLEKYEEAIACWDEMRELLEPILDTDPGKYAPVLAGILRYIAQAYRTLGDETRAAAAEAEAKAIREAN